jgi:hypothetical protein
MKAPSIVVAALLLLSTASAYADDAATIKLQCRVGTLDVGPLELTSRAGPLTCSLIGASTRSPVW